MKKALSILAMVLTLGAVSYQIANAGSWRGREPGNIPAAIKTTNNEKWQAFKGDTADLRWQLREKRRIFFRLRQGDKDKQYGRHRNGNIISNPYKEAYP